MGMPRGANLTGKVSLLYSILCTSGSKNFKLYISCILYILNYLKMEYWKIAVAIFPSRKSVFLSELLKLPRQSPQIGNTRKYLSSRAGPIQVRILTREYTRSQYENILHAYGANTRKYWLVEAIENDWLVTEVGESDEIHYSPSSTSYPSCRWSS